MNNHSHYILLNASLLSRTALVVSCLLLYSIFSLALIGCKGDDPGEIEGIVNPNDSLPPEDVVPPTVSIASPPTGSSYEEGEGVSFRGSAIDVEDGVLSDSALVWTSNRDGQIGTGTAFVRNNLSVNSHLIVLTVKDQNDNIGADSVNVTVRARPEIEALASYSIPGLARDIYILDNYAYVALNESLEILNVADPSNPVSVGSYGPDEGAAMEWAEGIHVSGTHAYIVNTMSFNPDKLIIIDVSDPMNPLLSGSYDSLTDGGDLDIIGSYAYVADGSELKVIDVSDPSNPTLHGSYGPLDGARSVTVHGSYAYVAEFLGGGNLVILDISNPSNPVLRNRYDTPGNPHEIFVSGQYAYIADYANGLQIVDIANPSNPIAKGSYVTGSSTPAGYVHVAGNLAFMTVWDRGLQVLDISNVTNPTALDTYYYHTILSVFAVGNTAYVCHHIYGIAIYRFTI